jgi:hypothetical protein
MTPVNMFSICRKKSCRMDAVSSILTMMAACGSVLKVGGTAKTAGMRACVTVPIDDLVAVPARRKWAHLWKSCIHMGVVMIWEFYLESAFYSFSEPFVKASHVHLVVLYVGEALFVDEELADAAEFSVVVPEFCSAPYPILLLHVN